MIESPNIVLTKKIEPVGKPKIFLFSKDFPETLVFNNLADFDASVKCNASTDVAKLLFFEFPGFLIGITDTLEGLDSGDIVLFDRTVQPVSPLYSEARDKGISVGDRFKDFQFYPTIKYIKVNFSFSEPKGGDL